jgi:hypothetical protein
MGEKRKKSLWARIMTCIQINRALGGFSYVPLSSKEQRYHLVRLIEYRAELALYEAYKAAGRIMPWDHFVLLVQHNCGLKKAVYKSIMDTISSLNGNLFNFNIPEDEPLWEGCDSDERIISAEVIDAHNHDTVLDLLTIRTQFAHFKYLIIFDRDYTWRSYQQDLEKGQELWGKFARALQRVIWEADYKAAWDQVPLPELPE